MVDYTQNLGDNNLIKPPLLYCVVTMLTIEN
jgi:hypothetical protein